MQGIVKWSALVALATGLTCASARAIPAGLNLSSQDPDVQAGFIQVGYDHIGHLFSADGNTGDIKLTPSSSFSFDGTGAFTLRASIDNSGNPIAGGTFLLDVEGDLNGTSNETLFHGTQLINASPNFSSTPTDLFEFLFLEDTTLTWSNGMHVYAGQQIGVILDGRNILNAQHQLVASPSFAADFSNDGNGAADTFVPEPTVAGIFLSGFAIAALQRRRRQ